MQSWGWKGRDYVLVSNNTLLMDKSTVVPMITDPFHRKKMIPKQWNQPADTSYFFKKSSNHPTRREMPGCDTEVFLFFCYSFCYKLEHDLESQFIHKTLVSI